MQRYMQCRAQHRPASLCSSPGVIWRGGGVEGHATGRDGSYRAVGRGRDGMRSKVRGRRLAHQQWSELGAPDSRYQALPASPNHIRPYSSNSRAIGAQCSVSSPQSGYTERSADRGKLEFPRAEKSTEQSALPSGRHQRENQSPPIGGFRFSKEPA